MDSTSDRRSRLALLIEARGFLRVAEASELLSVSEVTIRTDLSSLEAAGRVVRVHGGAMPSSALPSEPSVEQALALATDTKSAIGALAASLVNSGQSVLLDVGSTALAVAQALVLRSELTDVAVITNGLSTALALEPALPRFTVVMTGGTLRPLQHSLVNPGASAFLESVHADIAFIGCNGIDTVRGVTNINYPEAEVKRRMLQSSNRHVLVADSSKLGQAHLGVIGGIDDFDVLVTGGDAPAGILDSLRQRGMDVLVASTAAE